MPELPEVEVVKNDLKKLILNKKITNIFLINEKIIKFPEINLFTKMILNKTIKNINRIGKYLIFILDEIVLVSHLRMEGKYIFLDKNNLNNNYNLKHIMITFELDNKYLLHYLDSRKFGTMHLYDIKNYLNSKELSKLGIEPFDKNLTIDYLIDKWQNKKQPIKTTLLDQTYISGIGNIYADEILYSAKIHPLTRTKDLLSSDIKNIIILFKTYLTKAIENGGTRIKSFETVNNIQGNYQKYLKVHTRSGHNCYNCNLKIIKIKINNRGTYFCNNCQKLKNMDKCINSKTL